MCLCVVPSNQLEGSFDVNPLQVDSSQATLTLTAQLQLGALQSGERLEVTDVRPASFWPASIDVQNCRLVSPSAGASITSCELLDYSAVIVFDVTFAQPTFIQVQIGNFRNPAAVRDYQFEIARYSAVGNLMEAKDAYLSTL